MCRKHTPKVLFDKPDEKTQQNLYLAYILHGHGDWIVCTSCELTGCVTSFGNVRWFGKKTVGYLGREKEIAKAKEWNKLVAGETTSDQTAG